MDSTEVKNPKDCDEDCVCDDCEMRVSNDDESILVSVSPRTFELPKGAEKKTKMKIKNNNPYPIYFKASTSNTEVFRPLPDNGCIQPNGKASLDVQFYDSAMPLRRHEEVIVFTSVKPFDQNGKGRVCPYCLESFDFSKHHFRKTHSHTDECLPKPNNGSYETNAKRYRHEIKNYKVNNASYNDDFEINYKAPQQKCKTEYQSWHPEKKDVMKMLEEDKKKIALIATDYVQKHPKLLHSDEKMYENRDHIERKTKRTIGSREMCIHAGPEMCIHAPIHRRSASGCECTNCVDLWTGKEDRKRLERYLESGKQNYVRTVKSEEHVAEAKSQGTENGTYSLPETKYVKDERKCKVTKAHVLARILRTEGDKESLSDTDLSELSSRDIYTGRTRIISEEDYMKKKEKLKKKLKKYAEESESTASSDGKDQQKETDIKSTKIERKATLKTLEDKCNVLISLSWANLVFILLLILMVVGGFSYCYISGRTEETDFPSIKDILKYFG